MSNFDLLGGLETEDVQVLAMAAKCPQQPKAVEAPKADSRAQAGRSDHGGPSTSVPGGVCSGRNMRYRIGHLRRRQKDALLSGGSARSGVAARMHGDATSGPSRGRGRGRGDRPSRSYADRPTGDSEDGVAGRGEGRMERRGFGRGGRGRGRGGGGGQRREYDRRDGTGRGHEHEKRGGAGKGNWGTAEVEEADGRQAAEVAAEGTGGAAAGMQGGADPQGDAAAATENGAAEEGAPAAEAEVAEEPEEEKTMTLEEYEKIQAAKREGLNKEAAARAVDMEQFKGMTVTKKKSVDEDILDLAATKELGKKKQGLEKEKKEKNLVADVGFRVEDENSYRPRGGGRGGGRGSRGGRGRGERGRGPREVNGGSSGLNLTETAFPALA